MQPNIKSEDHFEFPFKLAHELLLYSRDVEKYNTPDEILAELDRITESNLSLKVLLAARFPQKITDWGSLIPGKTVFLHGEQQVKWWDEWVHTIPHTFPVGYALARMGIAPYSWAEAWQVLEPLGIDRWGADLAKKHGMHDGFTCPVGGRWVVAFWSAVPLMQNLTKPTRIMLFTAASFAAMRLEKLVELHVPESRIRLIVTPRELAVLRLLSIGTPFREAAQTLKISEETVRTHLKKAQLKLGARNRTHVVAEAIRQQLIP